MDLNLHHQTVSKLDYDYTVALYTDAGYEIRIEEDYTVTTGQSTTTHSPEPASDNAGPLDLLNEQVITAATADADGTLSLTVANGATLQVVPSEDFEAWTLAGPHGHKIVCLPGGELAIWEATDL